MSAGLLLAACTLPGGAKPRSEPPKPTVRIGAMNFTEQTVLAELYGQAVEAAGYPVERRTDLGSREGIFPALEAGELDLYPEYLASALAFVSQGSGEATPDPNVTHERLAALLSPRGIEVLDHAPAADTNAFVVTRATADRYRLVKLSDLARYNGQFVLGGPPECTHRPFCQPGLETTYGVRFKDFKPLDTSGPETVAALDGRHVDVGLLFSTDARIMSKGFVRLQDDRGLQLAENITPIVRSELLRTAQPDLAAALNAVSAQLTTDDLAMLNKQVAIDRRDARTVASTWLKSKGLIG